MSEENSQQSDESVVQTEPVANKRPNPWGRMKQDLNVTEDGTASHPGDLYIPSNTYGELSIMLGNLTTKIDEAQSDRSKEVAEKKGVEYIDLRDLMDLTPVERNAAPPIYVTKAEHQLMQKLQASMASSYTSSNKNFLKDDFRNLPVYSTGSKDMAIGLGKLSPDHVTDPVMKINIELGLSTPRTIPLWSSGFRLQINSAETIALLNLETEMLISKIDLSAESLGFTLSSSNIHMDVALMDFILRHALKSTADTTDPGKLKHRIALTDYHALVLGAASTFYPDGYTLTRDVFTEKDGEVTASRVKRKVFPNRMLQVRDSRFEEHHKRQMARLSGTTDVKTLTEYRESLRSDVTRFVDIGFKYLVKLRVPTLADFERIGTGWQNAVHDSAKAVMGSGMSETERRRYIERAAMISSVMFQAHWVEGFWKVDGEGGEPAPVDQLTRLNPLEFTEDEVVVADRRVDAVLRSIAGNPNLSDQLIDGIEKFIDEMTLSFVVTPREAGSTPQPGEHPKVIVVNPVNLFFTLLRHKILEAGA